MAIYYLSRIIMALVFGSFFYLASGSWLVGLVSGLAIAGVFLYLPKSGRYRIASTTGTAPFRRDEWLQGISQRAARNAWVGVTLAGALIVLFFGLWLRRDVPSDLVLGLLVFGWAIYFASDYWMRK